MSVEAIGTAPIERLDVLHGTQVVQTVRPYADADLGRRVRVLWQGAEYRGRGRETIWLGKLLLGGNRITRFAPVNFLNPERTIRETAAGTALAWDSVTTGNLAGVDLWLDQPNQGSIKIETNIVSGEVELSRLAGDRIIFEGGGLDRKTKRLSAARDRLESARQTQPHGLVLRKSRYSGLRPRDTGRWQPSVVKPNLPGALVRWI